MSESGSATDATDARERLTRATDSPYFLGRKDLPMQALLFLAIAFVSGKIESPEKISGTVDARGMGLTGEFTATKSK